MKLNLNAVILSLFFLQTSAVHAGHERGNALDFHVLTDDIAWFRGDESLPYCIDIDSTVSKVDRAIINREFTSSVQTWKTYYFTRVRPSESQAINFNFVDSNKACSGNEKLQIKVGAVPTELGWDFPLKRLQKIIALAAPNYDAEGELIESGTLWLNSEYQELWERPFRLHGILLHELGHVFGNGHIEGTIMSELHFVQLFETSIPEAKAKYLNTQIDHGSELVHCLSCDIDLTGTMGISRGMDQSLFRKLETEKFERLFKVKPVGTVRTRLIYKDLKATLQVSDDEKTFVLPLDMYWGAATSGGGLASARFKTVWKTGDGVISASEPYFVATIPGMATLPSGEKISITWERNMSDAPVVISFVEELPIGEQSIMTRSTLFQPDRPWDIFN